MLRVQRVHRLCPLRGRCTVHLGVGQGCADGGRLRGRGVRGARSRARHQCQRPPRPAAPCRAAADATTRPQ